MENIIKFYLKVKEVQLNDILYLIAKEKKKLERFITLDINTGKVRLNKKLLAQSNKVDRLINKYIASKINKDYKE